MYCKVKLFAIKKLFVNFCFRETEKPAKLFMTWRVKLMSLKFMEICVYIKIEKIFLRNDVTRRLEENNWRIILKKKIENLFPWFCLKISHELKFNSNSFHQYLYNNKSLKSFPSLALILFFKNNFLTFRTKILIKGKISNTLF